MQYIRMCVTKNSKGEMEHLLYLNNELLVGLPTFLSPPAPIHNSSLLSEPLQVIMFHLLILTNEPYVTSAKASRDHFLVDKPQTLHMLSWLLLYASAKH